ncbi:hypothetical protein BDB01DRAFT_865097 [Pilobolus umbonatus]|nr:hypothetical protein BDB01DRAFT_865097 [Pilobolus umbonatus]
MVGESAESISPEVYWENTIRISEAALSMLSTFENNNYELVDKATLSLRTLVNEGRDWNTLKNSISSTPISAKLVTTEQQLDEMMADLEQSQCIAIDCEFMSLKNSFPELKLIQLAVSKYKAYAVHIDSVGHDILDSKFRPFLENEKYNFLGWAFKGDALAIESYFKQISLAPVLDLQIKMKEVAVEEMNLFSAMKKYANSWNAIDEFTNAKSLGHSFNYAGDKCIWNRCPLPVDALVYAIFDVVSLIVLNEMTANYETQNLHFWPFYVLNKSTPKALERWHRQRSIVRSSSTANNSTSPSSANNPPVYVKNNRGKKNKFSTKSSPVYTEDGFNDDDPIFQNDLKKAMQLSIMEQVNSPAGSSMSAYNDIVVGELSDSNSNGKKEAEVVSIESWEPTDVTSDNPFFGNSFNQSQKTILKNKSRQVNVSKEPERNVVDNKKSSSSTLYRPSSSASNRHPIQSASPSSSSYKSPNIPPPNSSTSASPQCQPFLSKPKKENYSATMKTRSTVGENAGSFVYGDSVEGGKKWSSFMDSSRTDWEVKKKDSYYEDLAKQKIDEDKLKRSEVKFDTVVSGQWNKNRDVIISNGNNWEVKEERPDTMLMPMNSHPMRTVFSGPKVSNPNDTDDDQGSSDSDSEPMRMTNGRIVEKYSSYIDCSFLTQSDRYFYICGITDSEQLNMINIPEVIDDSFKVVLTFHIMKSSNGATILKAIQLFLSTFESYTILMERVCPINKRDNIRHTKVARLLTDPKIKRIAWYPQLVKQSIKDTMGIDMGPTVDLASKLNCSEDTNTLTFMAALEKFIPNNPYVQQYFEAKKEFESTKTSKFFSITHWDKDKISDSTYTYSAWQGLALYMLHDCSKKLPYNDEAFTVDD